MCGIAGTIGRDLPDDAIGRAMADAIRYRGRDAERTWTDGRQARLLHSRLSIIALADGDQPMRDPTGRYTIVYNGEVYNYVELREAYRKAGATFRTASDTEVVLQGYVLKGAAVCQDLIGMFALAIWDSHERTLFLARDRLGKKPLYYAQLGERFHFASTIDAFHAIPGWTSRLLPSAMDLYVRLGSFPNDLTIFEQANALPPGCCAVVRPGDAAPRIERYWQLRFDNKQRLSTTDAVDAYEAVLTDAIRVRLRADVPLALTFSGGVDSGTIATLCARKLNRSPDCYTIDYDTLDDPSAETAIARQAAEHLGLPWRHIQYDYRRDLFADAGHACQAFDQPCSQLAMAYSQRLYDTIGPLAKVVLCGNGADELFTGYVGDEQIRARDRTRELVRLLPGAIRRRLPKRLRPFVDRFMPEPADLARYQGGYLADGVRAWPADDRAVAQVARIVEEIEAAGVDSHLDLRQFMGVHFFGADANFRLPDITGLRGQVEVRSPFLDHRVVEFAAQLPGDLKVGREPGPGQVKFLPKRLYERYVPREIAWSTKKGMAMNVRFGDAFATEPAFAAAAERSLDRLAPAGIDAAPIRAAWTQFTADLRANRRPSPAAGTAMSGFMLGLWLAREPLALSQAA